MINISNKKLNREGEYTEISPIVFRTATPISLEQVSFIGNTAQIAIKVEHYQDEAMQLKDDAFDDVIVRLKIDNTEQKIDKRSGQYSDENTPQEFVQGEFSFFLTQKLASIEEMLVMGILRADTLNRFD